MLCSAKFLKQNNSKHLIINVYLTFKGRGKGQMLAQIKTSRDRSVSPTFWAHCTDFLKRGYFCFIFFIPVSMKNSLNYVNQLGV